MIKKLSLLILLLIALASFFAIKEAKEAYHILPVTLSSKPTDSPHEQWQPYAPASGKFKSFFPTLPQHATENLPQSDNKGVRKYEIFVSEKNDGSIFMISLITYPENITPAMADEIQNQIIQEMIKAKPNGRLKSTSQLDFQQQKARDFSIENEEIEIDNRLFFFDKTLYILTYTATKQHFNRQDFDYFLKNFQLLN